MKLSRKVTVAVLFFCPLFISLTYISCAPMKSKVSEAINSTAITSLSPNDICDPTYNPASNTLTKATLDNSPPIDSIFKNQKVILNNSKMISKATDQQLKDSDIEVLLDITCAQNNPGALTLSVLKQNNLHQHDIAKGSFQYHITDDLKFSQLQTLADQDPCVIGITTPGQVKTSSLTLPSINDPSLDKQVHLAVLNFAHAYQYMILPQSNSNATVKIGFADTGVDCTHPDLQKNLVANCGYNVLAPGTYPTDNDGHGTHTAGTAAAVINNGTGVAGIAGTNVKIYSIKVIDVNSGTTADLQNGIQNAISNGVEVLNISIQSENRLPSVESAIVDAVNAGIVVVMAAGNHGAELGTGIEVSPAMIGSIDGAITVGSIDAKDGHLSHFSNFGNQVEIAATGAIDSSVVGQAGGLYSLARMGQYQRLSGTSQAAPVVAGAAALLVQFFKQHNVTYTPAVIEHIIKASTDITGISIAGGGRVLNFSKLTRNAYAYANVPLCSK